MMKKKEMANWKSIHNKNCS